MWWPELDFQVLIEFIYMTSLPGVEREDHWALRPTSACKTPPGFTSWKGVSGWGIPSLGHRVLGSVGDPCEGGQVCGALRAPAPTWCNPSGKEHCWGLDEAELSSPRLVSVVVTPGLLLTFAPGERCHVKTLNTWWWLNQLCSSSKRSSGTAGVWHLGISPLPALSLLHRWLAVTKLELNMVCFEGANGSHLSPFTVSSIRYPWFSTWLPTHRTSTQ